MGPLPKRKAMGYGTGRLQRHMGMHGAIFHLTTHIAGLIAGAKTDLRAYQIITRTFVFPWHYGTVKIRF